MLRGLAIMTAGLFFAVGGIASAIPAFPGAEGAAKDVTGGRGTLENPGDVYIVTTLEDYDPDDDNDDPESGDRYHPNDSAETPILGSLRYGIMNAPAEGRTIVFTVGGQIDLHDSLRFDGKSDITIAGQTAPGGGITLAKHDVNIDNANNVIFQHIRIRPGDRSSANHPNPAHAPGPAYNPDALWVQTSTNIMIDHVTASWGTDETISTTHNSNNVTVQWSTISQALQDGDHTEGDPHSYGSLINGGAYTFHHNLYAHNLSRHPRAQASGNYLRLDWVNNIIANPDDEFGNSDSNDPFDVNMVGNYGIKLPATSATNLMKPQDDASNFYVSGNFMDSVVNGIVDGSAVNGAAVFEGTSGVHYTLSGTRLSPTFLPEVAPMTAQQAYVQVLSRAGASNFRDPIDRKLIRTVMNQYDWGANKQTDADIGGYPTLPAGSAPTDSNSDGVPDSWATANGHNVSTPLNATFDEDGYTYLEKYIHSLTPNAYAPVGATEHTIRTSFGNGADAFVSENGGAGATSSGNGTGTSLDVGWAGAGGTTNQAIVLKFDLSEIQPGSITNARLDLTTSAAFTGTHNFKIYGLEHEASGWDWQEGTVQFNGAPGLTFDGNSGTLGINPTYSAAVDTPNLYTLGTMTVGTTAADTTLNFNNLNLAVFLNLAAYFQDTAQDGLVTLILEQTASASTASFHSWEGNETFAPRLVLDALLAPAEEILIGDYNGDGKVSAADFTVWRDNMGAATLLNRDPNNAGPVGVDDFNSWKDNYGNELEGSGAGSSVGSTAVPEPAGLILVLIAAWAWAGQRRCRGGFKS